MNESTVPDEAPRYDSFGPSCERCSRPDMSNMTWQDGMKHFFSTHFAAPRMWPLGYILGSSYSPFHVERAMPSRSWRDAFEDLLALEAGREMIHEESRKAEDVYSAKDRYEDTRDAIAMSNLALQRSIEGEEDWRKSRQAAAEDNDTAEVKTIDDQVLPHLKSQQEFYIMHAQRRKAEFEEKRNASASSQKPRGQWMASLITSGALPAWYSDVYNSMEGSVVWFRKVNPPPELDAAVAISEFELHRIFQMGQPHAVRDPDPLPSHFIKAVGDGADVLDPSAIVSDAFRNLRPGPSSIYSQRTVADPIKLPNGSVGTKVVITNTLYDGRTVTKEFEQEPVKVLEEVENARKSMKMLMATIEEMSRSQVAEFEQSRNSILAPNGSDVFF